MRSVLMLSKPSSRASAKLSVNCSTVWKRPIKSSVACFKVWGLMLMGGLCYTVGAGFYAKKKPYFHMIWHLFILAASALQYIAIVYVM